MPPKAKGKKAGARKMPPPLPPGEVLTDAIRKEQWVIGSSIGKGGFGEIYIATLKGQDIKKAEHVIKIEPHENGPLFCELSYYRRVAKEETIDRWVTSKSKEGLKYLPCPKYITSGNHDIGDLKYRFMVMQRFGDDIEKHFRAASKFCENTVSYLALRMLEGLEFLHESEYVHADIKGSNILIGAGCNADRVYLVDYGLAYRFNPEGIHKEYKCDPKKAHDGTIEFTSIDAHNGASPSRRGDLEILGYCLLQWACGKLPWEDNLTDKNYVARKKNEYHKDAARLVGDCGGSKALEKYMAEVYKLQYNDVPQYSKLRKIFEDHLQGHDPKTTLEWLHPKAKAKPAKANKRLSEEGPSGPPVKQRKLSPLQMMHVQSSSEGSDQVDTGEKKAKGKKAKIERKRKGPPIANPLPKKAKMEGPPKAGHLPKAKIDDPPIADGLPKGKKAKIDGPSIADRLPEVVYPPELGYSSENKVGVERAKPGIKARRERQGKGKNPLLRENGTADHGEAPRRSERNKGKDVCYTDPSSSFNDSRGATASFQESSDEEDMQVTATPTTKRKRKRA